MFHAKTSTRNIFGVWCEREQRQRNIRMNAGAQMFSSLLAARIAGHYYFFTRYVVPVMVLIGLCLFCCLVKQQTKRRYPNNIVFSIIMWYFRMHLMKPRVWLIRHMRNHSLSAFFIHFLFSFSPSFFPSLSSPFFDMRHILPNLVRVWGFTIKNFTCDNFFHLVKSKRFRVWMNFWLINGINSRKKRKYVRNSRIVNSRKNNYRFSFTKFLIVSKDFRSCAIKTAKKWYGEKFSAAIITPLELVWTFT